MLSRFRTFDVEVTPMWPWQGPSWAWSYAWAALVALSPAIASIALAAVRSVFRAGIGGTRNFVAELIGGVDGRWSTSRFGVFVWTTAVAFALLALAIHFQGSVTNVEISSQYLLLLGIPAATAVGARTITGTREAQKAIEGKPTLKRPAPPERNVLKGLSQLVNNDAGVVDLGDFQYVLFNVVLLLWAGLQFFAHSERGLPPLPDSIVGIVAVSAGAYVAKKAVGDEPPHQAPAGALPAPADATEAAPPVAEDRG
jgi:hypothetical protein